MSIRKFTLKTPPAKAARSGMNVTIDGLPQLIEELRASGLRVNSSLRSAMRKGMKVIQAEAETNARAFTQHKVTAITASTRAEQGKVSVTLGIKKDRFYAGFFETGVQPHEIKGNPLVFEGDKGLIVIGGVRHPGMPAIPWLRPAVDAKQGEAIKTVGDVLRDVIEKKRQQGEKGESDE